MYGIGEDDEVFMDVVGDFVRVILPPKWEKKRKHYVFLFHDLCWIMFTNWKSPTVRREYNMIYDGFTEHYFQSCNIYAKCCVAHQWSLAGR